MKFKNNKYAGKFMEPTDNDILQAYIHKNSYSRADARRIKRQLRKLAYFS